MDIYLCRMLNTEAKGIFWERKLIHGFSFFWFGEGCFAGMLFLERHARCGLCCCTLFEESGPKFSDG